MRYDIIQSDTRGKVIGISGPYANKRAATAALKRFERAETARRLRGRLHDRPSRFLVVRHGLK